MTERDRLEFVRNRDGDEDMLKFAEQSLFAYVKEALKASKYGSSIDEFVAVLKQHGRHVEFVSVTETVSKTKRVADALAERQEDAVREAVEAEREACANIACVHAAARLAFPGTSNGCCVEFAKDIATTILARSQR